MREKKKGVYQKYLKNLLDRLLALVGTAALSWLLLGVGIAVRLDSPGPVLFRQKRVGRNGQYFYIYKFRTMRIDTPHDMPTIPISLSQESDAFSGKHPSMSCRSSSIF